MELGLVSPTTMVDTRGPIRWGKFKIRDFHDYGAKLPVWEVITKSSNIGTARIAQMIGAERQQEFLANLGFTKEIPLEMIEAS